MEELSIQRISILLIFLQNSLNMMLNTALNGGCIYFTTTTTPINIVSNFFIFIENSAR